MELKKYEREGRWGDPKIGVININRNKGQVTLNGHIVRTLDLHAGDQLILAKDIDSRNDWYISFSKEDIKGYRMSVLHPKNKGHMLSAYCSTKGIEDILTSVRAEKSVSFILSLNNPKQHDGMTWYRILTAVPKLIH